MALDNSEQNHISNHATLAKFYEANYTKNVLLNYQWNGAPDYDTTITQEDIDAIPTLKEAGVTVADLNEMNYINFQVMTLLQDRLAIVVKMARLG